MKAAVDFTGNLSIWGMTDVDGTPQLEFLGKLEPDYKVQSAIFIQDSLVVLGSDRLEIYGPGFVKVKEIRHPLLCGGHMLCKAKKNTVWVTCAPGDLVLRFDLDTEELLEKRPVGHQIVQGVPYPEDADFSKHYIPTDLQRCHVNAVETVGATDTLLVTLWIQGMVASLDAHGKLYPIVEGFRGCHGGRFLGNSSKTMYFTDSAGGALWLVDMNTGQLKKRVDFDCKWLHDTLCIGDELALGMVADKNRFELRSITDGTIYQSVSADTLGQTMMFATYSNCGKGWTNYFRETVREDLDAIPFEDEQKGMERQLIDLHEKVSFYPSVEGVKTRQSWLIEEGERDTYLLVSDTFMLPAGNYNLSSRFEIKAGRLSVGLQYFDGSEFAWLENETIDATRCQHNVGFEFKEKTIVRFVIASAENGYCDFELPEVKLSCFDTVLERFITEKNLILQDQRDEERISDNSIGIWAWLPKKQYDGFKKYTNVLSDQVFKTSSDISNEMIVSTTATCFFNANYKLDLAVEILSGDIAVGFISKKHNKWIWQKQLNSSQVFHSLDVKLEDVAYLADGEECDFVISGANSEQREKCEIILHNVELERYIPPVYRPNKLVLCADPQHAELMGINPFISHKELAYENVELVGACKFEAGEWEVTFIADLFKGDICISLLDKPNNSWVCQLPFDKADGLLKKKFILEENVDLEIWIVAFNQDEPCFVDGKLKYLTFEKK
ncbi:hypothetical protein [Terasakiella sp.]|uniref:hypothetical protein n=1 Tax=Terasakiella sp. TaxID=2034861 RepID=UPI003AA83B5E